MDQLLEYLLYKPIERWGNSHVISIYQERNYTYGDYVNKIEEIAKFFKQIGVEKEAVVLYMDDCPACIIAFLGLVHIGAKPLIVSPKTSENVLQKIVQTAKCRYLIKEPSVKLRTDTFLIDIAYDSLFEYACCMDGKEHRHVAEVDDDVCYLALTSGSCGVPKIVKHSVQEMEAAIYYYANSVLNINEKDTIFSIPKINFTYGLANSLFFSFALGAKAILYKGVLNSFDITTWIEKYNVTCFFAVPSVYEKIIQSANEKKYYLEKVRLFVSAGEYLPGELNEKWQNLTHKYINDSVGCSETGSAYLVNMNPPKKMGSAGMPVPGYHLEFENGSETQGMLVVDGPSNAIGYLNDEVSDSEKFVGGKIYTGDWFRKDSDGYYWFLGRKDDLIKKNGRWVSLNEVSNYARKNKGVLEVACFYNKGQIVLVLETSSEFEGIEKLKNTYRNDLEHYKCPDIIVLKRIPYNANGKIDYLSLKGMVGNNGEN